jgi:murein DD-endopeptidase MepM/ murein hydrolase activator NlpD
VSLVAGLMAGTMAAAAAMAPDEPARKSGVSFGRAAVVTPPGFSSAEPAEELASIGQLRAIEAAAAEEDFRQNAPGEASRSAPALRSFQRPATGAITGPYGERRRSGRHPGIDFDGVTGDPVMAAGPGTVVHAGQAPDGYSGYGRMVLVDHGGGIQTLYAHLSRVGVGIGTRVQPGDILGAIGTTGSVTGSHLHFEVRVGGKVTDPRPWLA